MQLLAIKYKIHDKTYKTRVTYKHSANIIAGLIQAGAKITTAVCDTPVKITEYQYDQQLDDVNEIYRPKHLMLFR